jgi:membrane protein YqaA with SNARE-associated domain
MEKIKKFIFRLIENTIKISKNRNSIKFLGLFSFLESIIIPIPPDLFLIPIVLAKKNKWFFLGLYCTFFSVLGGIAGYFIGYFFWDIVGSNIVNFYNAEDEIILIKEQFAKYGLFIIIIAGFTPLPYKIFTIGSGLLSFNFFIFILCSLFSRGLRFISLSYLIYKYGDKSILFVKKYFYKLTILFIIILTIVFFIYING